MGAHAEDHSQTLGRAREVLRRIGGKDQRNQRGQGHTLRTQPTQSTDWDSWELRETNYKFSKMMLKHKIYPKSPVLCFYFPYFLIKGSGC